jgi:hypothetical protein
MRDNDGLLTPSPREEAARLPRWTRDTLRLLRLRLKEANDELTALKGGPELSNTFVDPYSEAPTPLGNSPRIEFLVHGVKGGKFIPTSLHVQLHDGRDDTKELEIYSSHGSLVMYSQASNVIRVRVDER